MFKANYITLILHQAPRYYHHVPGVLHHHVVALPVAVHVGGAADVEEVGQAVDVHKGLQQ